MATTTTNLGLRKPAQSENWSIANDFNANMQIIDDFVPTTAKYYSIADNTDLNTLNSTGIYRSPITTAKVGTLVNCPVSVPFLLIIAGNKSATTGIVQFLCYGGGIYARRATSSGFPANWSKYSPNASKEVHYADTSIPIGTAAGSYKVGTFSSLDIPTTATILAAQCTNVTQSVCHVAGFAVNGSDIYVYLPEPVAVAAGAVRIIYQE